MLKQGNSERLTANVTKIQVQILTITLNWQVQDHWYIKPSRATHSSTTDDLPNENS